MIARKAVFLGLAAICQIGSVAQASGPTVSYLDNFPDFNARIDVDAPGDVDTALEATLAAKGQFSLVQREFELYAWQLFTAVNSPVAAPENEYQGSQHRNARWEDWANPKDVATEPDGCVSHRDSASLRGEAAARMRHLRAISTLSSDSILDATVRPSLTNTPLVDQHGNYVYYESLIDPNQVAYLCDGAVLSQNSASKALRRGAKISFPAGTEDAPWSGSYTLKLAWRLLDQSKGDRLDRYYTDDAEILDLSRSGQPFWRKVTVGLVGMHLVHKTRSAPERIWATFEHVDNLDVDAVDTPGVEASFANPLCPLCDQNRPSRVLVDRTPTQVFRALPIPLSTEKLNMEAQKVLASRGSVWQFYKLVGVQWPGVAGDIASATPAYLANAVMETFAQPILLSSQSSGNTNVSGRAPSSCMSCHSHAATVGGNGAQSENNKVDFSWFMAGSQTGRQARYLQK